MRLNWYLIDQVLCRRRKMRTKLPPKWFSQNKIWFFFSLKKKKTFEILWIKSLKMCSVCIIFSNNISYISVTVFISLFFLTFLYVFNVWVKFLWYSHFTKVFVFLKIHRIFKNKTTRLIKEKNVKVKIYFA